MLQLILGIAGTGKTTRVLDEIDRLAGEGRHSILLVPEQFSSSAEGMAYRRLGDEKSAFVQVLSFRTLAERILKSCGGAATHVLADAERAVLVRRALDGVAAKLSAFARQRRSAAFCNLCAQTLAELKTAGATPAAVRDIASRVDNSKLLEIALIFEAYEAQLDGAAVDPGDLLGMAAARSDCGFFDGVACFVDGFDGFTAPEYELLGQVMARCRTVTVSLCCDALQEPAGGPDLFTPVRRAAAALMRRAQKAGLAVARPLTLALPLRPQQPALARLNRLLAGQDSGTNDDIDTPEAPPPALWLTEAQDEWDEVRLAAAEMHRLALSGVPYSRMALVCRDPAAYESVVRRQFALYDIPFFYDAAATIEYTPPVAFIRAALALLREGLGSGPVLALLKTGLCGYTESEIYSIENYVYTWSPKADDWRRPFENNPEGLMAELDEEAAGQLAAAEAVRAAVVPRLEDFVRRSRRQPAGVVSKNLYLLLDRFGAPRHAEETAALLERRAGPGAAEEERRAWDLAMQLLDTMARLLGEEVVRPEEYDELFLILVRSTDFGRVPQTLECVLFSGADRMRLAEPDYCFVVGAAEGEFPMQVGYSGLLTHIDRDELVAGGVEMPGSFENRVMLEDMFFYKALCSPRRGLYLSWPARRAGVAKTVTAALAPVAAALAPPPLALDVAALAATPAAAYDLLAARHRAGGEPAATLRAALARFVQAGDVDVDAGADNNNDDWVRALALLDEVDNPGDFLVTEAEALERLVGREMTLSATVVERYYSCRFSYYMERVLRVKPRPRAEISPLESGTFVHHVLEQVLRCAGARFKTLGDEELVAMGTEVADAFIAENFPDDTRRGAFRLRQIKATTLRLLCFMRDAAAGSDFEVDAVELNIDDDGDVAPLEILAADGSRVRVRGKVDRVDVLRADGASYLCIVDYKTGDKRLNLEEAYNGLNIQMLIYLDALCQNGQQRYPNPKPAGVLYLGADPNPATGRRGEAGGVAGSGDAFKMNGLLLNDVDILRALERDGAGNFIPVTYKKDGTPRKNNQLAAPEVFGEILQHTRGLLAGMAEGVHAGGFEARPALARGRTPCTYCPYRAACRHEDGKNEREISLPEGAFGSDAGPENGEVAG